MNRRLLGLIGLLVLAPLTQAAEMQARAQVVDVVPLGDRAPGCRPPRPAGGGLVELLAWDLRVACPPAHPTVAGGYRVFYRWDGRTYSRVMAQPPGPTIPLRVRLD